MVNQVTLTPTSNPAQREVCLGDTIVFSANAEDRDGGVANVTITGEVSTTCVQGNLGQRRTGTFVRDNPAPAANPGDEVSGKRFTSLNVPVTALRCQAGFSFQGVTGTFHASATNFHNGRKATATYSFTYPPTGFSCSSDPCWVPPNAILLETEDEDCDPSHSLQVGEHTTRKILDAGQCLAFSVLHPDLVWFCPGPDDRDETECAQGTNFVRVVREASGDNFRVECYSRP
ncbi:MAG: hypothetical protein ACE5JX_15750 [Acidobacteriota bacterium]